MDRLRFTRGDHHLVHDTSAPPRHTPPQTDPGSFFSDQRMGVLKALLQSHQMVSCSVKGSCTGGIPTELVFSFSCVFCMFCRMKCFTVAKVQILPPTSKKKDNPIAGGRPQTQLGTRYGWLLAHKELLHSLTGFVFNPGGWPYPYTLVTRKPGVGDGLVADNRDHETGLCRSTWYLEQVTDMIWPDLTVLEQ